MEYSYGWLDPLSITGKFSRIAPLDFQKVSIGGTDHFFDSAETGWRFYYEAAKAQNVKEPSPDEV